jgi:hypothetical protein
LRVDAAHLQARQAAAERVGQVGGRVGGGQVHAVAALHQAHRQRRGDGGLAHAALAHDHDQAVPRGGQFIGQRASGSAGKGGRRVGAGGAPLRSGTPAAAPARRQAHGVEGAQRHLVARQAGSASGISVQACLPRASMARATGVAGAAGVEHAVDGQPLVGQAQLTQLVGGARGLRMGRGSGRVTSTTVVSEGSPNA